MSIDIEVIEKYLQRAIDEFSTNPLALRFARKLLNAEPAFFCEVALKHLDCGEWSRAHRSLAVLMVQQDELLDRLASPAFGTRETAVKLFKQFHEVDPSFDVRLARKLSGLGDGNHATAFDSLRSTRALEILDDGSDSRRLLPILNRLTESDDPKMAARATLFVGRRLQNPSWTKRQLGRKDQRIRANAVEALWGIRTSSAIRLLEECLGDDNNRVVGNSLMGLHIAGRHEAKGEVMALSRAERWDFRSTAAWIMGKLADPEFKPRLTEMVHDEESPVRAAALRALIAVRRVEVNTIAEAAVAEIEQLPESIDEARESVFEDLIAPSWVGQPELRLDGSRF